MFDTHIAYIIEVVQIKFSGKCAALFALFRRFDVFIGCKVVHNHGNFAFIKNTGEPGFSNSLMATGEVMSFPSTISRLARMSRPGNNGIQTRVGSQYFLCHCHSHKKSLLLCTKRDRCDKLSCGTCPCCFNYYLFCDEMAYLIRRLIALTKALMEARMMSSCIPTPQ